MKHTLRVFTRSGRLFRTVRLLQQRGGIPGEPYQFKAIEGSSVYQIPVGPVHAGIIEPGHFRFSVIGETIVNLEVQLGYLHRGVEKLAEGRTPDEVVRISESISGDESAVNACGFCMAVEQISGVTIPPRAEYIRGMILELERAYSLLSDLAGMVTDIAHPVSASRLTVLRERLQREADLLCRSRFLKGAICIGGVSDTISGQALEHLFKTAGEVEHELDEVAQWVLSIPSVIDRFSTTGVVQPELIRSLALSGLGSTGIWFVCRYQDRPSVWGLPGAGTGTGRRAGGRCPCTVLPQVPGDPCITQIHPGTAGLHSRRPC